MGIRLPYVYWDTCVFLDGHRKTAGRIEHIEDISHEAKSSQIKIVTSALCDDLDTLGCGEQFHTSIMHDRSHKAKVENRIFGHYKWFSEKFVKNSLPKVANARIGGTGKF